MSTIIPMSGLFQDNFSETKRLISETFKDFHSSVACISASFSLKVHSFPVRVQGDSWRWDKGNILLAPPNGSLVGQVLDNGWISKEVTEANKQDQGNSNF